MTGPLFFKYNKGKERKGGTQWHIVAAQGVATRGALRRPQNGRRTSTCVRRSAGAASGCNVPHRKKKRGESMDFKETMNVLLKILAMVDKIYHAVVKDAEDADKEESEE